MSRADSLKTQRAAAKILSSNKNKMCKTGKKSEEWSSSCTKGGKCWSCASAHLLGTEEGQQTAHESLHPPFQVILQKTSEQNSGMTILIVSTEEGYGPAPSVEEEAGDLIFFV